MTLLRHRTYRGWWGPGEVTPGNILWVETTGPYGLDGNGVDIYFDAPNSWIALEGNDLVFLTPAPVTLEGDDLVIHSG